MWLAHPCDDGFSQAALVSQFKPNPFGLYDMTGNVRGWVEDATVRTKPRSETARQRKRTIAKGVPC